MGFFSDLWKKIKGWLRPSDKGRGGINIETEGTNKPIPVIYGFMAKAPCIKVLKVTTDKPGGARNEYLHMICIFCEGEIDSIGTVYFNGIAEGQIDNERYYIEKFTGADNQAASATLRADLAKWKLTSKLSGLAYVYVRLKMNKGGDWWSGEPAISANIKGLKVLDLRDSVVKYTENLPLCTYDYATNTRYGKGLLPTKLDTQSFIDEANFTETTRTYTRTIYRTFYDAESRTWETFPVGTENATVNEFLISCNIRLDTNKKVKDNLEDLLGGMRAIFPESDGKYRLSIEKEGVPVYAFTKDNMAGKISTTGGNQNSRYNRVIIKFRNILTGEQDEITYPEDDTLYQTWLAEDNSKPLLGEFTFDTINNKAEALQMGNIIANRSRQQMGARFTGTPETIQVEVGDIVTVDSQIFGWNAKPMRIEYIEIDAETGQIQFQSIEHQNTIYPWNVDDVVEEFVDTSFALPNAIEPPTGLAFLETINDDIVQGMLTWDDPNDALVSGWILEIYSAGTLVDSRESSINSVELYTLPVGSFDVKLYAKNSLFKSTSANLTIVITIGAENVNWGNVSGSERPANNATYNIGDLADLDVVSWGIHLPDMPLNLSFLTGSEPILNTGISLGADGSLFGAGGGSVSLFGLGGLNQFEIDDSADFRISALRPDFIYRNSNTTALDIGYTGDLNADVTANNISLNTANVGTTSTALAENYLGRSRDGFDTNSDLARQVLDSKINQSGVTQHEAAVNALNLTNAPASAGADVTKDKQFVARHSWNFRNSESGWVFSELSTSLAADRIIAVSTDTDPIISKAGLNINGLLQNKILVRMKLNGSSWQGTLYYSTSSHSSSELYKKVIIKPESNKWVTLEVDMTELTAGGTDYIDNNIIGIRLDLLGSAPIGDSVEIAWIAIGNYAADPLLENEVEFQASYGSPAGSPVGTITADNVSDTIDGSRQLAFNTGVDQGNSFYRNAAQGLDSGFTRDGYAVNFSTPWDSIPLVQFGGKGLSQSSALAANQFQNFAAQSISTSGFTTFAKLTELAGTTTLYTDTGAITGGTLDYEIHKTQSAQAFDDKYRFQFDVTVINFYEPEFGAWLPGGLTMGIYTNNGTGWVKRATLSFSGDFGTPAISYANQIHDVIVDALTNHGGREFGINIESSENGGSITFDSVKYAVATTPASTSATPAGAPDIEFSVLGGR